MAAYDNLPVYKIAYDLMLDIYRTSNNLTRDYKYTLGEKLKNELKDLIVLIYKANLSEEGKEDYLRSARESVVVIRLYMRMLHDLKQINLKRFVALSDTTEELYTQVSNWYKSVVKKRKSI